MACLDENTIVALIEGTLASPEVQAAEDHIDSCRNCRLLLAELAKVSVVEAGGTSTPTPDVPQPEADQERSRETTDGLQVGLVLAGRYRVLRLLGIGAMGKVYEVDDLQLNERVALKLLRPEVRDIPDLLQNLRHEVVLGRRISHSNVCRLYDIGQAGDYHFITMSLVQGQSLDQIMEQGALPAAWVVSVLNQICLALEAAHGQGVVHRDLKPSNIMIDATGKVVVMDFGLARDLRGEPSQSGMLIGSPAYWSPEQACGQRATIRSDIYSLGVMACELFGARRPLFGGEVDLTLIPERFRPLFQRCIRTNPEERFASIAELQAALNSAPPVARWRWGLAALVTMAAIGGLAYGLWPPGASRPAGRPAVSQNMPPVPPPRSPRIYSPAPVPVPLAAGDLGQPLAHQGGAAGGPGGSTRGLTAPGTPQVSRRQHRPSATASSSRTSSSRGARIPAPLPPGDDVPQQNNGRLQGPLAEDGGHPLSARDAGARSDLELRLVSLKDRLRQLEQKRFQRAIGRGDIPDYPEQYQAALTLLKNHQPTKAEAAVRRLEQAQAQVRIDQAFIARKLGRLTVLRSTKKLTEAQNKTIEVIFTKVHRCYFSGDYQAANEYLNKILYLMGSVDPPLEKNL